MAQTNVAALYAACRSLRFSGRLELSNAQRRAEITFLGGDPVEIDGGDTQAISLWQTGTFRAVQSLPDLAGELTGQLEQSGSLAITPASKVLAWVSEYRLTCDLSIERPGERAMLVFQNGQLASAELNGKPELGALVRLQGWGDGYFLAKLRPLFESGVIALKPPPSDNAVPPPGAFDLSRSIPLDLKLKARHPTLEPGSISVGPPSSPGAVQRSQATTLPPTEHGGRRGPLAAALLLFAGMGVVTLYLLHLPPFSPPPRVIERAAEPPPLVVAVEDAAAPVVLDAAAPALEHPRVDPLALEPHPTDSAPTDLPKEAPLEARLIAKGRLLLAEGHPHSALDFFHKAEQVSPKSALPKTLTQQALGKLGRADLLLDGKGHVLVDGKAYTAPKKVHVFAGPHSIDTGAGPIELVLKRGERHHLRTRP